MGERKYGWTFLTNHGYVFLAIAQEPDIRLRDIAARVGITERAAQQIVADLEQAGYLTRTKAGRRNHYVVHSEVSLRHPLTNERDAGTLLDALGVRSE